MPFNSNTLQAAVIAALFAVTVSFGQPTLSTPGKRRCQSAAFGNRHLERAERRFELYAAGRRQHYLFRAAFKRERAFGTSELITGLSAGMITYYWRVNATIGSVVGAWSAVWSF